MKKPYTDQLAEWVRKREKSRPRQDKGLVAFISVKEDIAEAIDAGYALKTIWEHLHETGKIPYRYETFLKHVKKHIRQKSKVAATPVKGVDEPKAEQQPAAKAPKTAKPDGGPRKLSTKPKEFEHNPEIKKEDLI